MSTLCLPFELFLSAPAGAPGASGRRSAAPDREVRAEEAARVEAARGGDADAFRGLVERYRGDVLELALRIVRSREAAEEVAQDAFVRAWRGLPAFRGESRFSTWLYRIATRCALDASAALARSRTREEVVEPDRVDAAPEDAGSSALDGAQLRRLRRILGELEPLPRAAVSLYYLNERSVEETARILDLPAGTVKTHLHRARASLRRAWIRETRREERLGLPRI